MTARALLLALALAPLSGCVLYFGNDTDASVPDDDDVVVTDASVVPDAPPPECQMATSCGVATDGRINLCGQVFDAETTAPVMMPTLAVRFYDAVAYAASPTTAPQLALDSFVIDSCGRFVAIGLRPGASNQVMLTIDDLPSAPNDHRASAVASYAWPGSYTNLRAYALRQTTDAAWTSTAGLTGGSFADQGAILASYPGWNGPAAGVTPTRNSLAVPADSYTFSDTDPARRSTVGAPEVTGADGAALFLHSTTRVAHSGTGVIEPSCEWDQPATVAIPGVLVTLEIQPFCPI